MEPDAEEEFEETQVEVVRQARWTARRIGVRDGSIAGKQRMRRLARRKDPREVSVNILRNTSNIVKRGTTGAVKKTIGMVKKSGVKVLKKFARTEKNGETIGGGDELHKFFYDLQSEEIEEVEDESLDVESRRGTGAERGSVGIDGLVVKNDPVGDAGMRRQTWTNLTDVLMGSHLHQQQTDADAESIMEEEFLEDDDRLQTIQEIIEISPCGKAYSTLSPPQGTIDNTAVINPRLPPTTPSRAASISSLHTQSSIPSSSPAKLYPISATPNQSLRQLSSSTQHLFNISSAYYPTRTTSDPMKHVSPPHPPVSQDGEITRGDDDVESVYSDILPSTVERSVSVLGHNEAKLGDVIEGRKFSTSTMWGATPLTFESRTVSSRQVSTNWIPTAPLPPAHDGPTAFPLPTTAEEGVIRQISCVETSIPVIDSWKWAPPAAEKPKEQTFGLPEERGKSVLERVRELDMVIDQAMTLHEAKKVGGRGGGRKGGMFGLWRS